MYHLTTPPLGITVTLPGAIASANGPQAAALSLSTSESLTANQLQNHVTQARRAREKLIDQVSKPPEPGWQSAMQQISDTVNRMEKVLSFLQAQAATLPVSPVEDMNALAVFPSGAAMQQSGRTLDSSPSAAESPAALSASAAPSPEAATPPANRVIYVMEDGVVIVGLPPEAPGQADARAGATGSSPEAGTATGRTEAPSRPQTAPGGEPGDTQASAANTVVNLPLTEDQQRASAELIALARKAYAQLQPSRDVQAAALMPDEAVGLTGDLARDPAAPPSPERIETAAPARPDAVDPVAQPRMDSPPEPRDPLLAAAEPFARDPMREAASAAEQQQMMALQLDGSGDIIYIVPPAKAALDLIA